MTEPVISVQVEPVLVDKITAAKVLGGIAERKLMQLVADGALTAVKLGNRTMFTMAELRRYATSLPGWEPQSK